VKRVAALLFAPPLALALLTACGAAEPTYPAQPLNKDPREGWVYVQPYDREHPSWGFELRYRCVGRNLYIENDDENTELVRDARECRR
jgi:outer membrane biogenesis lipoprotein LolB